MSSSERVSIPGVPFPFRWLNEPASWGATDGTLTVGAGPDTDWFVDPQRTSAPKMSAPALIGDARGDFQFSARVAVDFAGTYDAGVLMLYADDRSWAKLCFERSPQRDADGRLGRDAATSVRRLQLLRSFSTVRQVWLRIARRGPGVRLPQDKGSVRPIVHRIGLDEIYVPYALPDKNWVWRSAFDVGEYNIGQYAESLRKNVNIPENAVFLDEAVMSDTGSVDGAYTTTRATAIYERDAGSLWDRLDPTTYERDARFARELVVTATNNIGNYAYQTEYVFRLDGSMAVNVGLTGTTLNQGVKTNAEGSAYGSMVAPNISAPSHRRFFNFRIDFDVDGTSNRMVEVDTMPVSHPFGNVFHMHHTTLGTERRPHGLHEVGGERLHRRPRRLVHHGRDAPPVHRALHPGRRCGRT